MPHADSALVSSSITTKAELYASVNENLEALLSGHKQNWVSALSNAASLLYQSYAGFHHGSLDQTNWVGFYLLPSLFPGKSQKPDTELILGPFHGRPACQSLALAPSRPGGSTGVCAKSFNAKATVIVRDVHSEPGHIACDALTNAELVTPLFDADRNVIGVLDLDSEATGAFDEEDQKGLEAFVNILQNSVEWY